MNSNAFASDNEKSTVKSLRLLKHAHALSHPHKRCMCKHNKTNVFMRDLDDDSHGSRQTTFEIVLQTENEKSK